MLRYCLFAFYFFDIMTKFYYLFRLYVKVFCISVPNFYLFFYLQYLETMFTLLFQLLQQVTECDTKMHVLHVLSCVIERVNVQVILL